MMHSYSVLSLTLNLIIISNLMLLLLSQRVHNESRTDLMKCKLTQLGMEYRGSIAKTVSNVRCQAWYAEEPMHEVSKDIGDHDFPERSLKAAKNYCRNPTGDDRGPWCYTVDPSLIDDKCDVPLCNYGECRLSGPGAEYGGSVKVSMSGKKCKLWHKRYQLADSKSPKFNEKSFPEESHRKAGSFCRNPTGDNGGPWCYVDQEHFEYVEKEYCDVSFCDDRDCLTLTKNASDYTVLTKLNAASGNTSFWMKLWNPGDEKKAEARILLSVLPIPSSAEKVAEEWKAGVEIVFSNSGSRQTFPATNEEEISENTPEVLLGSKWTGIWITWGGGFISAGIYGTLKPLIMQEYKRKHDIISLYPETFLYYGLRGIDIMWSTTFCQNHCEVHTTYGIDFYRVWSMEKNNDTYDVRFYVRASQNIQIRLYEIPVMEYPSVTVTIGKDVTTLAYQESEKAAKLYLKEISSKGLLKFWTWKEFSISIFGEHLRLFSQKAAGTIELLYANENFFSTLKWFSIASENSIAHWTLFCSPEDVDAVEEPWPPNCISDSKYYEYNGTQWTAVKEVPCVPWISKQVPNEDKANNKFVDGSALKALNKCRNPIQDPNGPYCYAFTPSKNVSISKQYCPIRNCRSSECRMAGTANDYVGTLSETRSGRTCDDWQSGYGIMTSTVSTTSKRTRRPHRVTPPKKGAYYLKESLFVAMTTSTSTPKTVATTAVKLLSRTGREYFNDSLYPEGSAKKAKSYCRNPSRNIAGAWCYTTDPLVPRDLCNVRDCEIPEEYTHLVRGDGVGRRLYVLPEHRSEGFRFALKAWEPDQPDSITFVFTSEDGQKSRYILKIGALDNEKVLLYYESESEDVVLVKKKVLPHLLYLGKWSTFIVRIPRGKVLLYYEDNPTPLFEWNHPDPDNAFLPVYYYFGSERGRTVGVAFDLTSSCPIENTQTDRYSRILSLSAWSQKEVIRPQQVTFHLRGKGVISIPLLLLPAYPGFYAVTLSQPDNSILLTSNTYPNVTIFHKQKAFISLFTTYSWTNITIRWTENNIDVFSNSTDVFHYEHSSPLLFYFFSVGVEPGGWVTWTVNCLPADIDGPPIDGDWSEWGSWSCSASCNGGTGIRKRLCDSPKPNVKGQPCVGPNVMTGRCNEIVCGDVSEDTVTLINRRIRTNYTALIVKELDSIVIASDPDIVKLITTESPDSELQWSLNGVFVRKEADRVDLKDYNIEIIKASANDSGVYAMTLRRIDGTYSIIKVISLAVIPRKRNVIIRETLSTTVACHCTVLGHVYSDLQISWIVQNKTWKNYGISLPIAADIEHVLKINKTHRGLWKCVVKQSDLNFEWTTNMILLEVLGPPNWRTYLMEDQATHFFFAWLPNEDYVGVFALLVVLILLATIIGGFVSFIRNKKRR